MSEKWRKCHFSNISDIFPAWRAKHLAGVSIFYDFCQKLDKFWTPSGHPCLKIKSKLCTNGTTPSTTGHPRVNHWSPTGQPLDTPGSKSSQNTAQTGHPRVITGPASGHHRSSIGSSPVQHRVKIKSKYCTNRTTLGTSGVILGTSGVILVHPVSSSGQNQVKTLHKPDPYAWVRSPDAWVRSPDAWVRSRVKIKSKSCTKRDHPVHPWVTLYIRGSPLYIRGSP